MTGTRANRRRWTLTAFVFFVTAALAVGLAATSQGKGTEKEAKDTKPADAATAYYNQGMKLVEDGSFELARGQFEKAVAQNAKDPEALNMLAYTQRKTGQLAKAFANYTKALEMRPKFPQAREYLAEAHIQAAMEQIEMLKGYGQDGKGELASAVLALRAAAQRLEEVDTSAAGTSKKSW